MPVSVRSDVGISSWDPWFELVTVTRLETGTPSFSQTISGKGQACPPHRGHTHKTSYVGDVTRSHDVIRYIWNKSACLFCVSSCGLLDFCYFTSKLMLTRTVFPAFTTMKLFMLLSVNLGLTTKEEESANQYTSTWKCTPLHLQCNIAGLLETTTFKPGITYCTFYRDISCH